jgi:hypothetical protein
MTVMAEQAQDETAAWDADGGGDGKTLIVRTNNARRLK